MSKFIFLVLLAIVNAAYIDVFFTGRSFRTEGREHLPAHRRMGRIFLILLTVFVILLELYVRYWIGGSKQDVLFYAHMCFAVPLFVVTILINFWFNGERSAHHARLAYLSAILMFGANATGIPLILLRF